MDRPIAMKLFLTLFTLLLCLGCGGTKSTQQTASSCPAYPSGGVLGEGTSSYCVTTSAASYQITGVGGLFNSYAVSVTLRSNPAIPAGHTVKLNLQPGLGSGELVSSGSSALNFQFTATTNTSETCLPNPATIEVSDGDAGALLQTSWTTLPSSCK
jgi:hypothetical protein